MRPNIEIDVPPMMHATSGRYLLSLAVYLALALLGLAGDAVAGAAGVRSTLEAVKSRGELVCGVSDGVPGFATVDRSGTWSGMDVAFCEAVAAAVLGAKSKAVMRPMTTSEGFRALAAGEIDILSHSTAWTLSRDTELKVRFVDVLVFDGQGFMVPRGHGVSSVLELSGASVCVVTDTRAVDSVANYFGRQRMRYQLVASADWKDLVAAYSSAGCTALTGDVTRLAAVRSQLADPSQHVILPEIISKEPIGPAVRSGDSEWFSVVRWVLMALIEAEELGVDSSNVASKASAPFEDVRRLLGTGSNLGMALGLDPQWAARMVREVGNYGQIFERSLGSGSALKLVRGYNNLWTRGGLMYGVPIR